MIDSLERCDDGNQVAGDGCSTACLIEPGFECDLSSNCEGVDGVDWADDPSEGSGQVGGSNGGSGFSEFCGQDDIAIGFEGILGTDCGGASGGVGRLRIACAPIAFDADGSSIAESYLTNQHGACNPTGTVTMGQIDCPTGAVLVGVRGSQNGYLQRLEGICQSLSHVDGALSLGVDVLANGIIGSSGGNVVIADCPVGQVVVGVTGRAGQVIDQLSVQCAPLESDTD